MKAFLVDVSNAIKLACDRNHNDKVAMEPYRVTKTQLHKFVDICLNKYMESIVEPGT